jgi:hypothetical protein
MMIECNSCGKCCHYIKKGVRVKCPFLVLLPNGKTRCRQYHSRLGKTIGKVDGKIIRCTERKFSDFNYSGCPYNVLFPDKEMCPI